MRALIQYDSYPTGHLDIGQASIEEDAVKTQGEHHLQGVLKASRSWERET